MAAAAPPRARARLEPFLRHWPLILGFAAIAVPTMITLAREVWSREIGAHGPIVLATGAWLLATQRDKGDGRDRPAATWQVMAVALPALLFYVFGRAYDFISLEAAALYGVMLAFAMGLIGLRAMARNWFPFAYLAFMVPPPGWLLDRLTAPLRMMVSRIVTDGLSLLGYPITRDGVTMRVAQYNLLVEDACAGMNSIVGLSAITLLYIFLMHRASWRYAALLTACILPVAIVANIIRVTVLVLLTYYAGDAVAQGFLHVTTGMALFMIALVLIFLLDAGLQTLMARRRPA